MPFPSSDPAERERLLESVRSEPLAYGTWGPLKRLYKQVEAEPAAAPDIFGALVARFDTAPSSGIDHSSPVLNLPNTILGLKTAALRADKAYLFATRRNHTTGLFAFDMEPNNPLTPKLLGSVDLQNCNQLIPCGSYVAALCGGMTGGVAEIFDADAEGGPVWKGRIDLQGYALGHAAYPYIFLSVVAPQGKFSGMKVLDISNPSNPQIVSQTEIKTINQIAVDGALVAVAFQRTALSLTSLPSPGGLRIFDIAYPRQPRSLGSVNLGNARAVDIQDGLAVALVDAVTAGSGMDLVTVSVQDPSRPVKLGSLSVGRNAKSVEIVGRYAFVMGSWGYPTIVDLRNPSVPVSAGHIDLYGTTAIAVHANRMLVGSQYNGVAMYNISNPGSPARIGAPPSTATFSYMKRRARRFLRKLAKQDPDAYVEMATACLAAMKVHKVRKGTPNLDISDRWVLADILYGGSNRYVQTRHSRGALVSGGAHLRARRREERVPSAWDRHPELLKTLLSDDTLLWQTHEAVFKILQRQGEDLRDASDTLLARYLDSEAPLLIHYAARRVSDRLHRRSVSVGIVAAAYLKSAPTVRREIERDLPEDLGWRKSFADTLLQAVQAWKGRYGFARRAATACEILIRRFPDAISPDLVILLAGDLLNTRRPLLIDLVRSAAGKAKVDQVVHWLTLLDSVRPGNRANIADSLADAMRGQIFTQQQIEPLVFSDSAFIRESAWMLLSSSDTSAAIVRTLWTALLDLRQPFPATETAMTSASALALLTRAGIGPEQLSAYLVERPFLVEMLTTETFNSLLRTAPPSVILMLAAAADDTQWAGWRPSLFARLSDPAAAFEFWPHVDEALRGDPEGTLAWRLLGDLEIAATIHTVDNPALLDARDPAFGLALAEWARRHAALFTANSPLLLQGATHVLPEVRGWSLERVRSVGMELPFALRLLESQLPQSVATGVSFFEAAPAGDPQERGNALALCDSPFLSVRRIGQEYVTARWQSLPQSDILTALFQSFHPDIQAFVATLLGKSEEAPQETPVFDREVLRTRQKARKAKELVKTRQAAAPSVDTATLLSLARGRTPRDAEWALAELARRAVAGEQIEGITVDGVVGG